MEESLHLIKPDGNLGEKWKQTMHEVPERSAGGVIPTQFPEESLGHF
jgi:hypothetical protein